MHRQSQPQTLAQYQQQPNISNGPVNTQFVPLSPPIIKRPARCRRHSLTLSHRGAWQRERRRRLDAEEREQTLLHHLNRLLQGQRDAHQPKAAAAASQPVARPAQDRAVDFAHSDVKEGSLVGGLKGRREDAGCGGVGLAAAMSGQTEAAAGVPDTRYLLSGGSA